jgi:hypothetical protein
MGTMPDGHHIVGSDKLQVAKLDSAIKDGVL